MYRFLLTPRWWGINVFVLLAIPFCIFMGSWQLGRFEDRVEGHRTAEEHSEQAGKGAATPLTDLLPVTTETSGKRAEVKGTWADQFTVPDRELDGKRGFYVLALLKTDGGKAIPVVRGWLPAGEQAPPAPTGATTLTGSLQASESSGSSGVSAAGGLPEGQLGIISAASLVNLVPYDVHDAWITADRATDGLRTVPPKAPQGTGLDLKAFQNLGYTGEWFIFAGFVLFMWFRLLRREIEFARDAELGLDQPAAAQPDGSPVGQGGPEEDRAAPEKAPAP
ncbi:SURF1 family protein [Streptomyces sp. TRM66268-LWL]|uniref:SURF1-like protein n=1 Tax=Streptomyces polyasparticus TaxID=2767826 RepID=A0ABR7SH88_9ACTN|nr:SURF1 family protein [Streptomyces polyasparticus]MBC9714589.1 SURF1 family protein [Streptomyces polyasparticus]